MIYCLIHCLVVVLSMACTNKYFDLGSTKTISTDTVIDNNRINRKGNVFFIIAFLVLSLLAALRSDKVDNFVCI